MIQFILDAMRGATALLLIVAASALIIWLIVPGMEWGAYTDAGARNASKIRTFNAMFGGLGIVGFITFCLMVYAVNH